MTIIYYLFSILLISSCSETNKKKTMTENQQWNRNLAIDYFEAYANFENKRFGDCIKLNNDLKLRAIIGAAEFEYIDTLKLLIIRGLIDRNLFSSDPLFKEAMLKKIVQINKNPPKKFINAYLENDITAFEINKEIPEKLNLRISFKNHKLIRLKISYLVNIYTHNNLA